MCVLSQLLQGVLIVWAASCLAVLTALAVVYARSILLTLWKAGPAWRSIASATRRR